MQKLEIQGQRFGRLTAIKYVYSKSGNRMWLCNCSCGTAAIVRAASLRRGEIKSCGCLKNELLEARNRRAYVDLAGKDVGRLRVVSIAYRRKNSQGMLTTYWNCKCECGSDAIIEGRQLRQVRARSCGCLMRETNRALMITLRNPDYPSELQGAMSALGKLNDLLERKRNATKQN